MNKGELAETYVFLHLLGEPFLHQCDENHKRLAQCPGLQIRELIRCPGGDEEQTYVHIGEQKWLRRRSENGRLIDGEEWIDVDGKESFQAAERMKSILLDKNGDMEECTRIAQAAIEKLGHVKIKANSDNKEDIILKLRDLRLGKDATLGFSIKAFFGNPPSLLNESGKNTSFCFRVEGCSLDGVSKVPGRKEVRQLVAQGAKFKYLRILGKEFPWNLKYIDATFHEQLALCVLEYYSTEVYGNVKTVCEQVINDYDVNGELLTYKIKRLLEASALGMTPGKKWDGQESANGGFIIAKDDGDIVAFMAYDRKNLLDYLYESTFFDWPGHGANLKNEELEGCIVLPLKIRFRKPKN